MKKFVYACDIGSTKKDKFAWAKAKLDSAEILESSSNIDELINQVAMDLNEGHAVALGFEAPMFLPVPAVKEDLSSGRTGEGSRSIFAPVGASVTTLGLHQVAYILKGIRDRSDASLEATFKPQEWTYEENASLLVWEAFVSGNAKTSTDTQGDNGHVQDAHAAVRHFCEQFAHPASMRKISTENPLSTLGAALLWSGWTNDLNFLKMECLVAKP